MKDTRIVNLMCFLIIFILFFIITGVYIFINNYFENQCINRGGKPIYNEFNRFEKCIGSDKE